MPDNVFNRDRTPIVVTDKLIEDFPVPLYREMRDARAVLRQVVLKVIEFTHDTKRQSRIDRATKEAYRGFHPQLHSARDRFDTYCIDTKTRYNKKTRRVESCVILVPRIWGWSMCMMYTRLVSKNKGSIDYRCNYYIIDPNENLIPTFNAFCAGNTYARFGWFNNA